LDLRLTECTNRVVRGVYRRGSGFARIVVDGFRGGSRDGRRARESRIVHSSQTLRAVVSNGSSSAARFVGSQARAAGECARRVFTDPDNCPQVASLVLAGAEVRPGGTFDASDRLGADAADRGVMPADLTATILHSLGVDRELDFRDRAGHTHRICEGSPVCGLLDQDSWPRQDTRGVIFVSSSNARCPDSREC